MRYPVILAVAAVCLLALAGTAAAQARDPFVPLIGPADTAGDTAPSEGTAPGTTQPASDGAPAQEGLPATGRGVAEWLALAYVLIAAGGAVAMFGWAFPRSSSSR